MFCEKPLALNVAQGSGDGRRGPDRRQDTSSDFQSRFFAQAALLKGYIERGDLGDIYYVRAAWNRRRGLPTRIQRDSHSKELSGAAP